MDARVLDLPWLVALGYRDRVALKAQLPRPFGRELIGLRGRSLSGRSNEHLNLIPKA